MASVAALPSPAPGAALALEVPVTSVSPQRSAGGFHLIPALQVLAAIASGAVIGKDPVDAHLFVHARRLVDRWSESVTSMGVEGSPTCYTCGRPFPDDKHRHRLDGKLPEGERVSTGDTSPMLTTQACSTCFQTYQRRRLLARDGPFHDESCVGCDAVLIVWYYALGGGYACGICTWQHALPVHGRSRVPPREERRAELDAKARASFPDDVRAKHERAIEAHKRAAESLSG